MPLINKSGSSGGGYYNGYTIQYGEKSLSDVIALGGIPLTANVSGELTPPSAMTYYNIYLVGSTTKAFSLFWAFRGTTDCRVTFNAGTRFKNNVDLDSLVQGDLEFLKTLTNVYVNGLGSYYGIGNVCAIVKWLEPK